MRRGAISHTSLGLSYRNVTRLRTMTYAASTYPSSSDENELEWFPQVRECDRRVGYRVALLCKIWLAKHSGPARFPRKFCGIIVGGRLAERNVFFVTTIDKMYGKIMSDCIFSHKCVLVGLRSMSSIYGTLN